MIKKTIQTLRQSIFILPKRNEHNVLAYWSGYFHDKNEEHQTITSCIGNYLSKHYAINGELTTWIEQVDHYSFQKGLAWYDGFYFLLAEMYNTEEELETELKKSSSIHLQKSENPDEVMDMVETPSGIKIQKGDILKLSDKMGDDYKETKLYDKNLRNPSWSLFYPSENDFKHIRLMHKNKTSQMEKSTYGNVWRILSHFPTYIQSIERRKGRLYINTSIFEIELEGALQEKEIEFSTEKEISKKYIGFAELLNEQVENYRNGLGHFRLSEFLAARLIELRLDWHNYNRHFSTRLGQNWCEVRKSREPK